MEERVQALEGFGDEEEMGGARVQSESSPARAEEVERVTGLEGGQRVGGEDAKFQVTARAGVGKDGEAK